MIAFLPWPSLFFAPLRISSEDLLLDLGYLDKLTSTLLTVSTMASLSKKITLTGSRALGCFWRPPPFIQSKAFHIFRI